MVEGVMSSVGMSILLGANVLSKEQDKPLYIHKKEGPFKVGADRYIYLKHWPVSSDIKKTFIFDFDRQSI